MLNILIADDEQLERMVLKQRIAQYLGEQCNIKAVSNGREAVEAAHEINADIVFMDIEMPGVNGIEASKVILKLLPDCKIIMLTAYSKFEYARESLSIGVSEYLLKPCVDWELYKAIDSAIYKIKEKAKKTSSELKIRETICDLTAQMEEQVMLKIIGGFVEHEQIINELLKLNIKFNNAAFAVLNETEKLTARDIRFLAKDMPQSENTSNLYYVFERKLYILCISAVSSILSADYLETQMQQVLAQCRMIDDGIVHCHISGIFYDFRNACSCFYHVLTASMCQNEKKPLISLYNNKDYKLSGDYEEAVVKQVLLADSSLIPYAVQAMLEGLSIQRLELDSIAELMQIKYNKIINILYDETQMPELLKKYVLSEYILKAETAEDMKEAFTDLFYRISKKISLNRQNHIAKMRQDIVDYLRCNYHRDISLITVAKEMNYSDTHFSKLFKHCFNTNFTSYLTELRVEEAKKMLQESEYNIKEISDMVGYPDPNYFTKVFRKLVGQTPSDYRYRITI